MDRPDDSPTRSLREARRTSMPLPMQSSENHPLSSFQQQQLQQPPQQQSQPTISLPPFPRRRSSPLGSGVQNQQHVSASISQPLSSGHPPQQQYHSHMDDPQDFNPSTGSTTTANQRRTTPPQPSLTYPRTIQRVPPPALVESDNLYSNLRDGWSLTDQYLDIDHIHHSQDSSPTTTAAGLNLGSGLIGNTSGQALNVSSTTTTSASMPKGPIIERDREREQREAKFREQKESSKDGDSSSIGGGSAGVAARRNDSLRRATRPPPPTQTQSFQTKNESPPPSNNQPNQPPGQIQAQRPPLYSDRSSPTYASPMGLGATNPQIEPQHYVQPHQQQQPSPTHKRDNSPPFRYEERPQPITKAKTPDRSLPVQEENEGEEDVTIKSSAHTDRERVRERERERERERDRQRERELDNETIKSRPLGHRLPTPQFSNSPIIPGVDRTQSNSTTSSVTSTADLSTTVVRGDEYDDERDGRSSRAGHRYEEEEEEEEEHPDPHGSHSKGLERAMNQNHLVQPDIEEQEDTETYTPRSPPTTLPQINPHLHNVNANINHIDTNGTNNNNHNVHAERITYHNNPSLSHLHFRPRTASSDAGGMPNLDAAILQHPLASEYNHNRTRGMAFDASSSFAQSHPFGAHTSPPQRVPTIEEIRAIADGALHRQTTRPGAPIPPTPPNNGTYPTLAYLHPSISPPPPRATPYPFSYPYQHVMQQSPDPHQMLQHLLGMQTDSTFSPSSTPYPMYDYSPFLPEHFRRRDPTMSMRSSPSHMPVNLPLFPANARPNPKRRLKRTQSHRDLARTLPPRGESTEPRETTPEPLDDDEDDLDSEYHDVASPHEGASSDNVSTERGIIAKEDNGNAVHNEDDEEANWIDEDDDEDTNLDIVHYESLSVYHPNPEKRRRRWEARWNELVKAFQKFDHETNSSMILMAAPAKSNNAFYSIRSRTLRRNSSQTPVKQAEIRRLRSIFRNMATKVQPPFRNQPSHMSLVERFEHYSSSSSDSIETREEELKNTLGAALSTINALTNIYEGRDQRWINEMGMRRDERERVDILLKQAFGFGLGGL